MARVRRCWEGGWRGGIRTEVLSRMGEVARRGRVWCGGWVACDETYIKTFILGVVQGAPYRRPLAMLF